MLKKIFKYFRDKFLKNKINDSLKILKSSDRSFSKPINKIGCIIDTNLEIDYYQILELIEKIGLKEKDIKIISFSDTDFNDPFSKMRISNESINFYGNIVSNDANEFISYDYDLLINYFGDNKILTLISSKVNSKFRVGFDNTNKDINDIIFSNIFNNFAKFSSELIKYLKKIK